jgi:CheY-like chemotaxis protein
MSVRGRERLLVVDDEPDLTDVLTIGFERLGYAVAAVNDPLAALARFESDAAAWDAVIVDQLMPAMTGTTLVGHLKRIRPDCPVVLCSGLHDGTTEQAARAAGADAFLAKPVEPRTLAGAVRTLLGVVSGIHALGSGVGDKRGLRLKPLASARRSGLGDRGVNRG